METREKTHHKIEHKVGLWHLSINGGSLKMDLREPDEKMKRKALSPRRHSADTANATRRSLAEKIIQDGKLARNFVSMWCCRP